MTVQELAMRGALAYSGITSLRNVDNAPSQMARGKTPALIADCAAEINGAMQFLVTESPHLFRQEGGGWLQAPLNISGITATAGSTTISGFSAYTDEMRGCTIRLSGDTYDYEVVSQTEISRKFCGTTGSGQTGTVYFDALPLATNVSQIIGPVRIPGLGQIFLSDSFEQFLTGMPVNGAQPVIVPYGGSADGVQNSTLDHKVLGRPRRYIVKSRYDATIQGPVSIFHIYPMPAQQYGLVFDVLVKPPVYTAADIDGDGDGADPGLVIPFAWAESTLLPLLKKRWMGHPSFNQEATVNGREIREQAQQALGIAENRIPQRGFTHAIFQ